MLDPHPQRLTLLQLLRLQPGLLQQLQGLGYSRGIGIATEDLPRPAAGVVEPAVEEMQHVGGDVATVAAVEGCFGVVEHALQDGEDGFVGDLEVEEEIHDPGGRAHSALVFE